MLLPIPGHRYEGERANRPGLLVFRGRQQVERLACLGHVPAGRVREWSDTDLEPADKRSLCDRPLPFDTERNHVQQADSALLTAVRVHTGEPRRGGVQRGLASRSLPCSVTAARTSTTNEAWGPCPNRGEYGGLVEGAWVIPRNGWHYLFYSVGDCCSENANYCGLRRALASARRPVPTRAGQADPAREQPLLGGRAQRLGTRRCGQ